jgi:hypothetical protein
MDYTGLAVVFVAALIHAGIGYAIARAKNREGGQGFALGCLLGPLGILIALLLPVERPDDRTAPPARPPSRRPQ